MYIIVSGEVQIHKMLDDGVEMKIKLAEGECFGEMAILDGLPRSGTVIASSDGTFLAIGREEFMDILRVYPEIALKIIKILSERMRKEHTNVSKTLKEQF